MKSRTTTSSEENREKNQASIVTPTVCPLLSPSSFDKGSFLNMLIIRHYAIDDSARSINESTLFDLRFDPVWPTIWLRSTHESTGFRPSFDPVRPMIWPFSTHDSTLFDQWFDHVWPMTWPRSTNESTPFESCFELVRTMVQTRELCNN